MAPPFNILRATSSATSGMGANLLSDGAGASFRVWAPNATKVDVLLRARGGPAYTRLPLGTDPTNADYHSADVSGVAAGDEYRFAIVNDPALGPDNPGGLFERVDPYARDVVSADSEAPAIVRAVPNDRANGVVPPSDYVIYQLHIGSFVGLSDGTPVVNRTATFQQVAEKLARIAAMGFTAVEFMPTSEDPDSPEGYAPSNYFAPEVAYGHPDDLRALIDACHAAKLAVILDVVYNHATAEYAWDRLLQFDGNTVHESRGIYFSTFDNFGPVPDFDRAEVQSFFVDNARQCFREFGADGLRFDSSHAIRDSKGDPAVMANMLAQVRADFPRKRYIAEHDNPSYAVGTLRFDASWQMGSGDDFVAAVRNQDIGLLERLLADPIGLPSRLDRVLYLLGSHDQIFADYEPDGKGGGTTDKPNNRYFVERVGGVLNGRDDSSARALARLGWLLNVTVPCIPMMFMGSECHHHGYWNPYLDVYGEHRFDNALLADAIGQDMVRLVTDANGLRAAHAALRGDGYLTTQRDSTNGVLTFKRFDDTGDVLLLVANLGPTTFNGNYVVSLGGDTSGSYKEVFNSQAPEYGGFPNSGNFGVTFSGASGTLTIALPAQGVLVFQKS
jgi:1,4-alpha-glucan branching enzyme